MQENHGVLLLESDFDEIRRMVLESVPLAEKLEFINTHPDEYENQEDLVCFPEIRLTKDQVRKLNEGMMNNSFDDPWEYYKGKCHNSILLSMGNWVNGEEQEDFQSLVNYAIHHIYEDEAKNSNNQ